jgi:hypothetical protein
MPADPKGLVGDENFVFEIDFMVKLLRACVWMPWRKEAMKDVVSCDKPREDANSLRSGDLRMGKPSRCEHRLRSSEFIG